MNLIGYREKDLYQTAFVETYFSKTEHGSYSEL